jgi:formiminotetrahydrofolate cyclodeaminase
MFDRTTTIDAFLSATAARQPTPGGGSVAALAGALAAAIGEMVLQYSIGKKDLAEHEPKLNSAAHQLQQARDMLLQLMVEDQEAYGELTAARKLAADDASKPHRIAAAVTACIRCPQAIGATAVAILKVCEDVVDIANPWLLSDLAVSADLAMATVRAASYNVRVNLGSVTDAAERDRYEIETAQLVAHGAALIQKVSPAIWSR